MFENVCGISAIFAYFDRYSRKKFLDKFSDVDSQKQVQ